MRGLFPSVFLCCAACVFVWPAPALASEPPDDRQVYREHWTWHQVNLRRQKSKRFAGITRRAVVNDVADIAVMQSNPSLVLGPNPWDLNGTAIQFTPVGAGYTVEIIQDAFDSNFGSKLDLINGVNPKPNTTPGDDAYVMESLGFAFQFYGRAYDSAAISTNGNIAFRPDGVSQSVFDTVVAGSSSLAALHNGVPAIAPFWHDLDGRATAATGARGVYLRRDSGRVVITWNQMLDFPNDPAARLGQHTFQLVLKSDGAFVFVFASAELTQNPPLTGIGPGTAPGAPEVIDFRSPPDTVFTAGVAEFFSNTARVDVAAVIQAFYESRQGRDDWDFLYFTTDFNVDLGGAFAYYLGVRNDIDGIGRPTFDNDPGGADLGSHKLQGFLNISNLSSYPELPTQRILGLGGNNGLSILAQEQGHRWGSFLRVPDPNPLLLLGRSNSHWSFFANTESTLSTPAAPRSSSMEGNFWRETSSGNFTSDGLIDGYSQFDQYAMGLRSAEEVAPTFVIEDPVTTARRETAPTPVVTLAGRRTDVSIDDVIRGSGPREPSISRSPKQWRIAWVLLSGGNTQQTTAAVRKLTRYRLAWESYFAQSTDYRGSLDSSLGASTENLRIAALSAADYSSAAAPGAIATIFGEGLTQGVTETASSVNLPTTLAGVSVLVNGASAGLYRASPTQISFVMPRATESSNVIFGRSVSSGSATVEVMRNGQLIRAGSVQTAWVIPSIFTADASGSGAGAILDATTYTPPPFNMEQSNGDPSILAVFCTGLGWDTFDSNVSQLFSAKIGGRPATVTYAGASGYPGMNQVNVSLPRGLEPGTHTLELSRNGITSNIVTIQLR